MECRLCTNIIIGRGDNGRATSGPHVIYDPTQCSKREGMRSGQFQRFKMDFWKFTRLTCHGFRMMCETGRTKGHFSVFVRRTWRQLNGYGVGATSFFAKGKLRTLVADQQNNKEPLWGKLKPLMGTNEPHLGKQTPLVGTNERRLGKQTPLVGTNEPRLGKQTPIVGTNEPRLGKQTPLVGTNEPRLGKQTPIVGTNEPRLGKQTPIVGTNGPVMKGIIEPLLGIFDESRKGTDREVHCAKELRNTSANRGNQRREKLLNVQNSDEAGSENLPEYL